MKKKTTKDKCPLCGAKREIVWHKEGWGSTNHRCPKLVGASEANKYLQSKLK
jgi:hypothetical protein